jgi:phage protein D
VPEAVLSLNLEGVIVRSPRLRAILNDNIVFAPFSAQITHPSAYSAAHYNLLVPLGDGSPLPLAGWSSLDRVRIRIQATLNPSEPFIDLIEGYCDTVQIHAVARFVILEGRDLSATLLDKKTPADFQNLTSSEIVSFLADQHGLTAITSDTTGFAGRQYGDNTNLITLAQYAKLTSDWDIVVALAHAQNYDLFVAGSSLYFQPGTNASQPPQNIFYRDLTDLRMRRMLPLSGGVKVIVSSWNSAAGTAVSATTDSPPTTNPGSSPQSAARIYTVIQPNLASSTAGALAAQLAQSIYRESMSIQFSMPGDTSLDARRPILLIGSGTLFDRLYKIDSIIRKFRSRSGYSQTVCATLMPG